MTASPRVSLPVAVILGRKTVSRSGWSVPSWRAVGVVAGGHLPAAEARGEPVHSGDGEEHFLWGGLRLDLYKDATEAYWSNLLGRQPRLFVLCTRVADGMVQPLSVTADIHEASSSLEGDDEVYSAPMPPEVHQYVERFVVEHHRPEEKRKRKRTDWSGEKPS